MKIKVIYLGAAALFYFFSQRANMRRHQDQWSKFEIKASNRSNRVTTLVAANATAPGLKIVGGGGIFDLF